MDQGLLRYLLFFVVSFSLFSCEKSVCDYTLNLVSIEYSDPSLDYHENPGLTSLVLLLENMTEKEISWGNEIVIDKKKIRVEEKLELAPKEKVVLNYSYYINNSKYRKFEKGKFPLIKVVNSNCKTQVIIDSEFNKCNSSFNACETKLFTEYRQIPLN